MTELPTIFDWLGRAEFMRGYPAAYLVLLLGVLIVALWDWRIALFALAVQYLANGLLFVDVLDPRLAVVKILVGWFVCLMLYITARQVNWGKLPQDVTPTEAVQLRQERQVRFGRFLLPTNTPFRIFLTLLVVVIILTLVQRPGYQLPAVPEHVNLAIYALAGLGLLGLSLTTEPLRAGMGLLMFLAGFELFYNALEQSIVTLVFLAVMNMVVTLAIAYLTQTRHALAAIFD